MQISSAIKDSRRHVSIIQDKIDGIYSFGHLQSFKKKPKNTKIIFFNKRFRLNACELEWIKKERDEIIIHSSEHVPDKDDQSEDLQQEKDKTISRSIESDERLQSEL